MNIKSYLQGPVASHQHRYDPWEELCGQHAARDPVEVSSSAKGEVEAEAEQEQGAQGEEVAPVAVEAGLMIQGR